MSRLPLELPNQFAIQKVCHNFHALFQQEYISTWIDPGGSPHHEGEVIQMVLYYDFFVLLFLKARNSIRDVKCNIH